MCQLCSRSDSVHPSTPKSYQDDYWERAVRNHGYGLRNYFLLMKYAEVIEALGVPRKAASPH